MGLDTGQNEEVKDLKTLLLKTTSLQPFNPKLSTALLTDATLADWIYYMKSGMSDLRFFDLLYQNGMESPKKLIRKRKNGRFWPKIAKK